MINPNIECKYCKKQHNCLTQFSRGSERITLYEPCNDIEPTEGAKEIEQIIVKFTKIEGTTNVDVIADGVAYNNLINSIRFLCRHAERYYKKSFRDEVIQHLKETKESDLKDLHEQ